MHSLTGPEPFASLQHTKPPETGGLSWLEENLLGNLVALPTSLDLAIRWENASHMIFSGSVQSKPHIRHSRFKFKEIQQPRRPSWRALVEEENKIAFTSNRNIASY